MTVTLYIIIPIQTYPLEVQEGNVSRGSHCVAKKSEFYRAKEDTNLYSSSEDTLLGEEEKLQTIVLPQHTLFK